MNYTSQITLRCDLHGAIMGKVMDLHFKRSLPALLVLLGSAFYASGQSTQSSQPWVIGIAELHRIDRMPMFKKSIAIGAVTSYDRTEGNDDGFSGKYSFVRKEGDNLVLADLKGPGCVYRIHTPTPTDDPLEFYFDGESKPRITTTFNQLYSGKTSPFLRPLVDYAGGGYTSYVPLPYKSSLKILLRAKSFQFYDLNYVTYPADAPIQSYSDSNAPSSKDIELAKTVFDNRVAGGLSRFNVPADSQLKQFAFSKAIPSKQAVTLFETHQGGRLSSFSLGPIDAFIGKDRDLLLRVTWDNATKPSFVCPVGDFFGYAWGKPAMNSAFLGTNEGMNYCNFPMPFAHAAKIELVSLREGAPVSIHGSVTVSSSPQRSDEGKFYAVWHRENPTVDGKPFTYFQSSGKGHIVGLALQAQGPESGSTSFFEGDDITTVDGKMAIHGTGSEDSFNGGWYDVPDRWDGPVSRGLSGCMAYQKYLGRSAGFRFFLGDAYSYNKSILQTIEHAPERNAGTNDYCAVTYLYSELPPSSPAVTPGKALLRVTDPSKITFAASWSLPISSFSFAEATVSRKEVPAGKGRERCFSFRAKGEDWFGPAFVSFICDVPSAGEYAVTMDAVQGPEQGIVQFTKDELAISQPIDLYSAKPERKNSIDMGHVKLQEGANKITFKITGKNSLSLALGFDLININLLKTSN